MVRLTTALTTANTARKTQFGAKQLFKPAEYGGPRPGHPNSKNSVGDSD
jgi:hypothetical protein